MEDKRQHCDEKTRLAEEFTRAAGAYAKAAKLLRASADRDMGKVLDVIEQARIYCQKTRHGFQAHMVKHRC